MAVTPANTVHAQGEELLPHPILKPPDTVVVLDHADVGLGRRQRGLRGSQAQAQEEDTHDSSMQGYPTRPRLPLARDCDHG